MFRFLLSAGLLASSIGMAHAAPKCPKGQIYRITKKVCVDKATAVRDGVFSFREKRATKRVASRTNQSARRIISSTSLTSANAKPRPATEVARLDDASVSSWAATPDRPASANRPASTSPSPANAPALVQATSAAASPFGALSNPWTSSVRSALPHSLFSLQTTAN